VEHTWLVEDDAVILTVRWRQHGSNPTYVPDR
jgi:hypothetical protein